MKRVNKADAANGVTAITDGATPGATETAEAGASETVSQALEALDQPGLPTLGLTEAQANEAFRELLEQLHSIEKGFGRLTPAGVLAKKEQSFMIVDASSIDDFVDKRTGELQTKHIFTLEFEDGTSLNCMQSDTRPRKTLAKAFMNARMLNCPFTAGPYKFAQMDTGAPQPAWVFEQQPGFKINRVNAQSALSA